MCNRPVSPAKSINLGLTAPKPGSLTTVTINNLPTGWSLNGGTQNANGSWTATTEDVTSLTITAAIAFAGAIALNVAESWTNTDGSTASASISDYVQVFAPASAIFALPGDEYLTGSTGSDLFVISQPIGNDVIYNFNALSGQDPIMVGFDQVTNFSDLQIADDANGNAVVTVGSEETITLHGVDATALTASNFVFY